MTIKYDGFAFVPKRCDKCGRKFIFEWYNKESFGAYSGYKLEHIICRHHDIPTYKGELSKEQLDKLIADWGKGSISSLL